MKATPGTVYLIGAGPGAADLITLRGIEILRQADVVLFDRLIPPALLDEPSPSAERIDVSKTPGGTSTPQERINALLIQHARLGRVVVRLKGGDPFIFGRGGEEWAACKAAQVPVEVVPGVSSALAAPAAAGIPLTHRGAARSFVVLTAATDPALGPLHLPFEALKAIDTLVILMGHARLEAILAQLLADGFSPATPAVCISCAWMPAQKVALATLETLSDTVKAQGIEAPSVLLIGKAIEFLSPPAS